MSFNRTNYNHNHRELKAKAIKYHEDKVEFFVNYDENDSKTYPGYLFLHTSVKEKYGVPNHLFQTNNNHNVDKVRQEWLEKTEDAGELYKNLYRRIILKLNLESMKAEFESCKIHVQESIQTFLDDENMRMYNDATENLQKYLASQTKNKKQKALLNIVTNNLSAIYAQTGLSIHQFLSLTHDINIIINNVPLHVTSEEEERIQEIKNQGRVFDDDLEKMYSLKSAMYTEEKYITNTLSNLKEELHNNYLAKKKDESESRGKYYRRWFDLTQDQKIERIESFVFSNYQEQSKVYEISDKLKAMYLDGSLKTNHIKWSSKSGYITSINVKVSESSIEIIEPTKRTSTKKCSTSTIITKSNENVVNEVILQCVLEENTLDKVLSSVKEKLKVNKLYNSDKQFVSERFAEFQKYVIDNPL